MVYFPSLIQTDGMLCGVTCLRMICKWFGKNYSTEFLNNYCNATTQGVSLLGIADAATKLGFETLAGKVNIQQLIDAPKPCILHWNQNHFVVLYKINKSNTRFYISDPAKGKVIYNMEDLSKYWINTISSSEEKGIALFVEPTNSFGEIEELNQHRKKSFRFLLGYLKTYRKYFIHILLGLILSCLLQLILPFLTQSIVDIGIKHHDISFIWLILLGELMIVIGRTSTDFIRRWLLLHISIRINLSLISDFFIKLLKLPMSFFETKLLGDLMQRMGDHTRVQSFLTNQALSVIFSLFSFLIFSIILLFYNNMIFIVFSVGSISYGLWIVSFLKKRKVLDYELFEQQATNQNETYQFITTMQEIKLQDCEKRRRWIWENTQADLFNVQMKVLKLQQTQEAGSIFINEVKNIIITVLAATAVINGQMSLGAMLAVQYIIGQLNSPVEQFMSFIYSLQDVKISLERINEIHEGKNEETNEYQISEFNTEKSIVLANVDFKYDPYALKKTLTDV
ncbi:MAG: cysteine peptidase family C39 domain-containing protein, partial [Muribaculum sp.]|nr:cysteine peptidase family C39 domain-containing protein [Muribaculum sp.]